MQKITRRSFTTATLLTSAGALMPTQILANGESAAKTLVTNVIADINFVINNHNNQAALFNGFERIFKDYGDVPTIARYCLGVDARRASAAQMAAFTTAFSKYLAQKYGRRFNEFAGGRIEVNSARAVKSFLEVRSTAYLRGQAPFEVVFLVSDKSGQMRFFNLFIEGVNMLLTERAEIGAMLDHNGGNLERLIKHLETQT